MKNVLRSTFGTLVVAAFLAIVPPMYARGGHGGGHGGHRGHHGGHAVKHAKAGHFKGWKHAGFRARGGRGHYVARAARGNARFAGRAYNWNGGRDWNGGYWGGRNWGGGYWNGGNRFIFIGGLAYPYNWGWGWRYPYSYSYYSYYPYWYYPSYGYKYDDCSVSRRRYFYP